MQCNEVRDYFADYLTQRLAPAAQKELARHLRECPPCTTELDEWTDIWVKMGSLTPVEAGEAQFREMSGRFHRAIETYNESPRNPWSPRTWGLVAVAAVLVVLVSVAITQRVEAPAGAATVIEATAGALHRTWGGQTDSLKVGERIETAEIIGTDDAAGAVLALADGSRVEMRAHSELSLERADDGMRIRLSNGSIVVNAAKQHSGHLYVQTKDVTVSVVGTVFVVNAEENGSRVAVIEGEVRVQQGLTSKKLLPGEQVATNPLMEAHPVTEEISWSRHVEEHLALLQQSAAPATTSAQSSTEPREAFEVASVRASVAAPPSAGPAGRGSFDSTGNPCAGSVQVDPGRFVATGITVYRLVRMAYGKGNCTTAEVLGQALTNGFDPVSGAPRWVKSDQFDIQAIIPDGNPSFTAVQLSTGNAPKLQMMIRALLADRFRLTLHRGMKDASVYVLTLGDSAPKLTPSRDSDGRRSGFSVSRPDENGDRTERVHGAKASMAELAYVLADVTERPVLDRTGIAGEFNYLVEFAPFGNIGASSRPSLFTALRDQLGLKLEAATAPMEILVIDRVEKPTEN